MDCVWKIITVGSGKKGVESKRVWRTVCGHTPNFLDANLLTPYFLKIKFCPYCGERIDASHYLNIHIQALYKVIRDKLKNDSFKEKP